MRCPVNYISFKQGFKNTGYNKHYGIDFGWYGDKHHNQDIMACDDGVVIYNRYQVTGGYCIQIKHDNGMISEYGHLLKNSQRVHEGDKVKKGQVIAKMGKSGMVTGEHLHFALLKSNSKKGIFTKSLYVDPARYINVYSNQFEHSNAKGIFLHTKKVTGTDGQLNVRTNDLRGKIVYTVKEGNDIESYGAKNNCNIVDNVRNYVCSKNYVK